MIRRVCLMTIFGPLLAGLGAPSAFGDIIRNGIDFKLADTIPDSSDYSSPEFTFRGRGGGATIFVNYQLFANPAAVANDPALGNLNPVLYGVAPDSNRELAFVETAFVNNGLKTTNVVTDWTDASGLIVAETPLPNSFFNAFGYFAPDGSGSEGVFLGQGAHIDSYQTDFSPAHPEGIPVPLDRGAGLYVNFTGGVFGTYVSQQIFIGNSSVLDQFGESTFVIYWDTGADVLSEAPEPSGLLLLGSGLIGIVALHRRFAGRMKLAEID